MPNVKSYTLGTSTREHPFAEGENFYAYVCRVTRKFAGEDAQVVNAVLRVNTLDITSMGGGTAYAPEVDQLEITVRETL